MAGRRIYSQLLVRYLASVAGQTQQQFQPLRQASNVGWKFYVDSTNNISLDLFYCKLLCSE